LATGIDPIIQSLGGARDMMGDAQQIILHQRPVVIGGKHRRISAACRAMIDCNVLQPIIPVAVFWKSHSHNGF
jgi:hypothetical protein